MQSTRKFQFIVIILTIGLVAFIFFFGRNNPTSLIPGENENGNGRPAIESAIDDPASEEDPLLLYVEKNVAELSPDLKEKYNAYLTRVETSDLDSVAFFKKIGELFDQDNKRVAAGFYFEQRAKIEDNEENWLLAADRFFEAQKLATDTQLFNVLVRRSVYAYQKVLEHNPGNLDARAELAVSLFESEQDPMKGVGMLVEIIQANPEHEKTLYYLGMINLRSGNYDKARERMEKLASLQPDKPFTYYYLGQIYLQQGEEHKALEALKEYRRLVQDPQFKERATHMINRIEEQL